MTLVLSTELQPVFVSAGVYQRYDTGIGGTHQSFADVIEAVVYHAKVSEMIFFFEKKEV